MKREYTRNTFDSSAYLYEKIRPSYPEKLIDDTISLSHIPKKGRILEIGCGTGKATEFFASRGYFLDCLDIGQDMASIASAKFKRYDNVRIHVDSFEDWDSCGASYDLILAAASFHWINPKVRFTKSASILRRTGALALFTNKHIRNDEGFFAKVQAIYQTHAPSMKRIRTERQKLWQEPVLGENLFNEPIFTRHTWAVNYNSDEYISLLKTYSDHLSLPNEERTSLFSRVKQMIDKEYAGIVRKHYEAILNLRSIK